MKKNMKFRKSALALGVMAALAGGQAMADTDVSIETISTVTITGNSDGSNNSEEGVYLRAFGPSGLVSDIKVGADGVVDIRGNSGVNINDHPDNGPTTIGSGAGSTTTIKGTLDVGVVTNVSNMIIQANGDGNLGGNGDESLKLSSNGGYAGGAGGVGAIDADQATINLSTLGKAEITGQKSVTINGGTDGTTVTGKLNVTGATSVGGTLGVTGATSLSTLNTSGLATLDSATVTNNATVGGTLGVTGATSVGGTLGVTGATSLSTLNTSGLATLDSTTVTNNATVGGTLDVTGKTTTNGLSNTDAFTQTGGVVSINDSSNFATSINTGTSSGNVKVGNASNTVSILGDNNNIGNAGASTNTLTGSTNTVTATGANTVSGATNSITATAGANNITAVTTNTLTGATGNAITATTGNNAMAATAGANNITAGTTNTLTGATGNAITATTGNNAMAATAGSNVMSANAAEQSNTLSATGVGGANNLTANAITGTNNIEAKYNNIGVSTAASINAIGNNNAGTTVNALAGAGYQALNNTSSTMGTGAGGMVQTNATNATIRASSSGTLASNGSTGAMVAGAGGGYTAYNSQQNTGSNTIGGVVDNKLFTNKINGNTFIDGNVYINGTLDYVSSNSANTTVIGAGAPATTSNIQGATQATSAGTAIVMKGSTGTQTVVDANGKLSNVTTGTGEVAAQSTASMTLTNGIGNTHGLVVTESQASLSGGVNSSTLTMDDRGATFSNAANGAPVTVTGVANGRADFDAVNVRQFAGAIAAVTAQANVPALAAGQDRSIGIGVGNFMGKTALALGMNFRNANVTYKITAASGLNAGAKRATVGAGAAWAF